MVEYCGHTIDQAGIHFSPAKLQKVVDFPKPRTITELRSFLGLANYYRDHVFGHSMIVHPLHRMLDGVTRSKSKALLTWTADADAAFIHIKERIQSCPKLFFLRDNADIVLETDASDYGVGGYLYQTELTAAGETVDYPVTFISQALTKEQQHWSTPQKEAYAIYYCITELDYLLCDVHFTLRTDHKNLIFLNMDTDKKVHRWKLALQEYDFTAVHIPGTKNVNADFFSRNTFAVLNPTVSERPPTVPNMLLAASYREPTPLLHAPTPRNLHPIYSIPGTSHLSLSPSLSLPTVPVHEGTPSSALPSFVPAHGVELPSVPHVPHTHIYPLLLLFSILPLLIYTFLYTHLSPLHPSLPPLLIYLFLSTHPSPLHLSLLLHLSLTEFFLGQWLRVQTRCYDLLGMLWTLTSHPMISA